MVSVSIETMILFIAGIVVAAAVAGTLTSEVGRVSGAIDDLGVDLSGDIRSDIEIISDAGSENATGTTTVYDGGTENITLHVKNTGSKNLPAEADVFEVLVDGEFEPAFEVEVVDGPSQSTWFVGDVVKVEIDHALSAGDHRVKLIVNGDEEVFEFRVV